jgi:hypothetical protein
MKDFSPSTISTNGKEGKHKNAQRNAEYTRNKKNAQTKPLYVAHFVKPTVYPSPQNPNKHNSVTNVAETGNRFYTENGNSFVLAGKFL